MVLQGRGDRNDSNRMMPRALDDVIVLGVRSDPEPDRPIVANDSQRAVSDSHPHGPESADLFEAEGGMPGIGAEQVVVCVGEALDRFGQESTACPEIGCGVMIHTG